MHTMIPSTLMLALSGLAPALAQLPPEILVDSYLLRAEQAVGEGDQTRARAEIDKIILLQKETEMELSDDFQFRYAKVADAVGFAEQALDAVSRYLTLSGREGRHYVEALELMNKSHDAIEGRKGAQDILENSLLPTKESNQGSMATQLDPGGISGVLEEKQSVNTASGPIEPRPRSACDLWKWRTKRFFWTATIQDTRACLDAGANPNARFEDGSTPLHRAAMSNEDSAVVQELLAAGADPNASDEHKHTPLLLAASYNENPMVIEELLAAGADRMARADWGGRPLKRARSEKNTNAIEVLQRKGGNPIRLTNDCRMWHTDAFFRKATVQDVRVCLEARANALSRYRHGQTALHRAAELNEDPAVSKALLAAGADPMAKMKWGSTPVRLAAENKNPAVIEVFFESAAEADRNWRWTPLHRAVLYSEEPEVVRALLAAGADSNSRMALEWTPLHLAARYGGPEVIDALLEGGADPHARDEDELTPLHLAAAFNKDPAVSKALLAAGADPNRQSKNKSTPLHSAAGSNENPAVVQALVAAGANPNARGGGGGWTPLARAVSGNENPAIIQALLVAGSDPNTRSRGDTPLHEAAENGNPTVVRLLLAAGADPIAKNSYGDIPMDVAEEYGNVAAAEVLRQPTADLERQLATVGRPGKQKSGGGLGALLTGVAVASIAGASGVDADTAVAGGLATAEAILNDQPANPAWPQPTGSPSGSSLPTGSALSSSGPCLIPGYPDVEAFSPETLGFTTCRHNAMNFQVRSQVITAALYQCMLPSASPEQAAEHRRAIKQSCDNAATMTARGGGSCTCPPSVLVDALK